jgi:hypothetical protein
MCPNFVTIPYLLQFNDLSVDALLHSPIAKSATAIYHSDPTRFIGQVG